MRRLEVVVLAAVCGACGKEVPVVIAPTLPPVNAPPPAEPAAPPAPVVAAKPKVTSDPDVPSGPAAARDAELARMVEPLLAAFHDDAGALSPDGKRLVWISDRDGVDQVYM